MSISQSSSSDQNMLIQLEVVPDDQEPADNADVDSVGRSLFDQLKQSHQTIKAAPTDTRGGGLIFDVFLPIVQNLHNNNDWLLSSIAPLLDCLLIVRERLVEREKGKQAPIKITIEVNGKSVTIESKDPKAAAEAVKHLQLTQRDQVKIKVRVPKKKRTPRRRR